MDISYNINYEQILPVPSVQSLDTIVVGNPPGIPNVVYDSLNYSVYTDSSIHFAMDFRYGTWTGHTSAKSKFRKREIIQLLLIIIWDVAQRRIQFLRCIATVLTALRWI